MWPRDTSKYGACRSVVSADEFNAIDAPQYRFTARGADEIAATFQALADACHEAQRRLDRPHRDECHHCGAPSPGARCRYCETVRIPKGAVPVYGVSGLRGYAR